MINKKLALLVIIFISWVTFALSFAATGYRDVVLNGSFECGLAEEADRPLYWEIGFPGEEAGTLLGTWHLDSSRATERTHSLYLVPDCSETETYSVSQFLDAPTYDLSGKTVTLSLDMRHGSSGGGFALLFAYNPESTDSLFHSIPITGYTIINLAGDETGFVHLADSFVATGPAEILALLLSAEGWAKEGVWFDDVQVKFEVAEAGDDADTADVVNPLGDDIRDFHIGAVAEIARNSSEAAYEDLPAEIAEIGDMINVFAHVKWNALGDEPLTEGHDLQLQLAADAKELGLRRMLTFDFTHDNVGSVGDINPLPDGTPVDSLSLSVRTAYINELLALVDHIEPAIVSIGIETSIFYIKRPDQWDNFVLLLQEARSALPDTIHMTTYCVLDNIIDSTCAFYPEMRDAWEQIMPYCESVGYSYYSTSGDFSSLPDSYFTALKTLAPDKPILIPEFGCTSDSSVGYSEQMQFDFLETVISQIAATTPPPLAIIWYQMFDTQYLGTPAWFKGFCEIGMHDYAGAAKLIHAGFRKMLHSEEGISERRGRAPSATSIELAPNPCSGRCRIRIDLGGQPALEGGHQLKILDIAGTRVAQFELNQWEDELIWATGRLSPGIYILKVSQGNGPCLTNEKIIVLPTR